MAVTCPICKIQAANYFSVGDVNQHITADIFNYYRCSSCGLIFIHPIPKDLSMFYKQNYPAYQMPSLRELDSRAKQEQYKLEILQKYLTSGRLLEIGPSFGAFAYLAKKAGFEVDAIEMDETCCQYLTETVGIRAINDNNITSALHKLENYNVITLWHAIEHLDNPWRSLEALIGKLLPGGILIVATPNPGALQFKIFNRYWKHVDAPRHLQLIPIPLLVKQMDELGLETLFVSTSDPASSIFSSFGWWYSSFDNFLKSSLPSHYDRTRSQALENRDQIAAKNIRHQTKQLRLFAIIFSFPIKLINKLLFSILYILHLVILKPLEKIDNYGVAYTAVFKKP